MMKSLRLIVTLCTLLAVSPLSLTSFTARAQDPQEQNQATPLMRGYRTGYSDGFQAGVSDLANNRARDFRGKADYDRGDRAYSPAQGSLEEYRDGYQQGFEIGYNAAFDRKPFDSSIPGDLQRRGATPPSQTADNQTVNQSVNQTTSAPSITTDSAGQVLIPRDTIIRVELLTGVSTDISQVGDPFQARVLDDQNQGAVLNGHIAQLRRPGKTKGTAQLQLAFDEIRMPDGRAAKMSAQVIEVIPNGNTEGVGKVDSEGGVKGTDSTKSDVKKVGAASGIGAIIGLIAGGGSGAAIGAGIGAGVGTAGVLSQRGKDIRLHQGQQLRIRTAGDVEIP
jgi:hypothetical protein